MSFFKKPACLDDFALKQVTRARLEHILLGVQKIPGNGVSGIVLWGPYGSGKTTMAELLPDWIEYAKTQPQLTRALVGQCAGTPVNDLDVLYKPCVQGQNGVQLMGQISNYANFGSWGAGSGYKFVILDEVDMLTAAAQASLKGLMTNTQHVIFIMTTNHINQVDGGVLNRSIILDMCAATDQAWHDKLERDFANQNEPFVWSLWEPIVQLGNGSCRVILNDIEKALALRNVA